MPAEICPAVISPVNVDVVVTARLLIVAKALVARAVVEIPPAADALIVVALTAWAEIVPLNVEPFVTTRLFKEACPVVENVPAVAKPAMERLAAVAALVITTLFRVAWPELEIVLKIAFPTTETVDRNVAAPVPVKMPTCAVPVLVKDVLEPMVVRADVPPLERVPKLAVPELEILVLVTEVNDALALDKLGMFTFPLALVMLSGVVTVRTPVSSNDSTRKFWGVPSTRNRHRFTPLSLYSMLLALETELSDIWADPAPPSEATAWPCTLPENVALVPPRAPLSVPPAAGRTKSFVTSVVGPSPDPVLADVPLPVSARVADAKEPAESAFVTAADPVLTLPELIEPAKDPLAPETLPKNETLPVDSRDMSGKGEADTR